jgi:hypothetical protein
VFSKSPLARRLTASVVSPGCHTNRLTRRTSECSPRSAISSLRSSSRCSRRSSSRMALAPRKSRGFRSVIRFRKSAFWRFSNIPLPGRVCLSHELSHRPGHDRTRKYNRVLRVCRRPPPVAERIVRSACIPRQPRKSRPCSEELQYTHLNAAGHRVANSFSDWL